MQVDDENEVFDENENGWWEWEWGFCLKLELDFKVFKLNHGSIKNKVALNFPAGFKQNFPFDL